MIEALTLADAREAVANHAMTLLYVSRPDCGVCTAIKPRVVGEVKAFPRITVRYVDLDVVPEAAGEYSIFTLPGILVFVDGKESIREARYVSIDELFSRIERLYNLRFDEGPSE